MAANAASWLPRYEYRLQEGSAVDIDVIYRRLMDQGFVVLRRFFEPAIVSGVVDGCKRLVHKVALELLEKGLVSELYEEAPFDRRLALLCAECPEQCPLLFRRELHAVPEMFGLFFGIPILDLMMGLIDADEIRLFPNYTVRPKMPSSSMHNVAWHQDAGLSPDGSPNTAPIEERLAAFGFEGGQFRCINCWTSLVPATVENGCMRFIPGSHKLGLQKHQVVAQNSKDATIGAYSSQIEQSALAPHLSEAVPIETQPGDLVIFSNLLFHSNQPNNAETIRWSVDWRYQDASCSTHRPEQGHIARSLSNMDREVQSADEWTSLSLA